MDITIGFEVFAKKSMSAAELPHEPRQREILIRLAVMWAADAHCRHEKAARMRLSTLSRRA
jgi:hypothetical protein